MDLTRRKTTGMLAAGLALSHHAADAQTATSASPLKSVARTAGIHIGSDSDVALASHPDYASLIEAECDVFVPQVSWKREAPSLSQSGQYLDPNIAVVTPRLALTGYHLLWRLTAPAWFGDVPTQDAGFSAMRGFFDRVARRLGDDSLSWNVVNEAINPSEGRPDGLRRTVFLDKLGPEYIPHAFDLAREVRPNLLRVYNDNDLELTTMGQAKRQDALLRLLDWVSSKTNSVQAVGLQTHIRARNFAGFDENRYRRFLGELAGRNLKVLITEFDVQDDDPGPIASRDRRIADIYRAVLSVAVDEKALVSISTWGLVDQYSWLNDPRYAAYRRPDGTPNRPLPFGDDLARKPAYDAMVDVLRHAPRRELQAIHKG